MNKASTFHAPLHLLDSEVQTFGCRCSNSDFCAKNGLPKVCALVRTDKICHAPPYLWPKQFKKLQAVDGSRKRIQEMIQSIIFIHGGSCWSSYCQYLRDLRNTDFNPPASPTNSWQQDLQKKLGSRFKVLLPEMPNWQNAKYLEWKIWFNKVLRVAGATPIIIGHSLGSIFLVKYFAEERASQQVRALFLVSTPYKTKRENPEFGDFALKRNPAKLRNYGGRIRFYHSKDDQIVRFDHVKKYQKALPDSCFHIFEKRGHFLQKSFPEIIRDLRNT